MSTTVKPRTRTRPISVIPRRCGPISGALLADSELLARVNFSDHALERFAERVGLPPQPREQLEPIIRGLLLNEGLAVIGPPRWARLRRPAPWEPKPMYLQAGFWMLFIARPDPRSGPSYHLITTVIAAKDRTWSTALQNGQIGTPPPPQLPVTVSEPVALRASVAVAMREHGGSFALPARILAVHRERQHAAAARQRALVAKQQRVQDDYERACERARERHLQRHGFAD
jgi:hypothetical protein